MAIRHSVARDGASLNTAVYALGLLFGTVAGCTNRIDPDQAEAIAAIERVGGQVKHDPRGVVDEVALGGTHVSAVELRRLSVFPELKTLSLFDTPLGDDDLEELANLPRLETLYLGRTRVTDAGLAHVARITALKTLGLSDTRVSDQGLPQLASLANLKSVNVHRTQVTVTGGNGLRAALPDLVIHY